MHTIEHSEDADYVRAWLDGHLAAIESFNEKTNFRYTFSLKSLPGGELRSVFENELSKWWGAWDTQGPVEFEYVDDKTVESIADALRRWLFRYLDDTEGEQLVDLKQRFALTQKPEFSINRRIFVRNIINAIICVAKPDGIVEVRVTAARPYVYFDGHQFLLSSTSANHLLTIGHYY